MAAMARPLRINYPGAFYHVTCRGNERRNIFADDQDRSGFLVRLQGSFILPASKSTALWRDHQVLDSAQSPLMMRSIREVPVGARPQQIERGTLEGSDLDVDVPTVKARFAFF
jgi:hypothetical protein